MTGRAFDLKLAKPSDSPVDMGQSLSFAAGLSRLAQLSANISDAEGWLDAADTTLGQIVSRLQQVSGLVIRAARGLDGRHARDAIANQIDQLHRSILGLANTQYASRPLFGGTASGPIAYDASGSYVGAASAVERTIESGVRIQVNVNGTAAFGPPGNDIFTTLARISDAVRDNGDLTELSLQLATRLQQVQTSQAAVGATSSCVERAKRQNATSAMTTAQSLANVEDVDMAQVLVSLQAQETTYQAAFSAAAKAVQPSLANFLQ